MDDKNHQSPEEVAASLLLTAGFLMEEASAQLALPAAPTREVLVEMTGLVDDTARQLAALATAAQAALRQAGQ